MNPYKYTHNKNHRIQKIVTSVAARVIPNLNKQDTETDIRLENA